MPTPLSFSYTIGLEIHTQLATRSKMFCSCSNTAETEEPNAAVCSICLGHPGVLPVTNQEAVAMGIRAGLALNCAINEYSSFDRKNYFYPDLPKGYQITQYDLPIAINGYLDITLPQDAHDDAREQFHVRINRLHLEEDAAKNSHIPGYTLVDYNRGGSPLAEIVTEPDLKSPGEAKAFLQELRRIIRYVEVSDGDMEKGHMRCDANVSIQFEDNGVMVSSPITEIKNLNSFRSVEAALTYEAQRLYDDWMVGGESRMRTAKVTVGWDDVKSVTIVQRSKEEAHDYRYFPEPDLPPLYTPENVVQEFRASLPELPGAKRVRFVEEYGVSLVDARTLTEEKETAKFFEQAASELAEWLESNDMHGEENVTKGYKLLSSWFINKLSALLTVHATSLAECRITPENFAEFVSLVMKGVVNSTNAQVLLEEMLVTGAEPDHIIAEKGLAQVSDESFIREACQKVIDANEKVAAEYKAGKENAIMFLVGQVMKESKGTAQPQMVKETLMGMLK